MPEAKPTARASPFEASPIVDAMEKARQVGAFVAIVGRVDSG